MGRVKDAVIDVMEHEEVSCPEAMRILARLIGDYLGQCPKKETEDEEMVTLIRKKIEREEASNE
jgi:hypothetical protein|tara:strand:- start:4115 stop:4306 length:192 start_codon:yes stop_codon:yes gene_type:complete